ncbi:hypothetical protein GCM10029992_56920 [Glycomyces albus]
MLDRGRRRAVAYYRVSTARQALTGTDAEDYGDSIATRQEACRRYAAEHGLEIIAEYPEPGGSGTAIDRRPRFRELLERVLHRRDVAAGLVYARSRALRNAYEALVTREEFRRLGVELLSTQESSETGPEGDLVTLILDGVNEYQSRKIGADVSLTMAAKPKTPTKRTRSGASPITASTPRPPPPTPSTGTATPKMRHRSPGSQPSTSKSRPRPGPGSRPSALRTR